MMKLVCKIIGHAELKLQQISGDLWIYKCARCKGVVFSMSNVRVHRLKKKESK